ncbi:MAG: hypothetical protein ABJ360_12245 [Roseobacter sp.]
MAIKMLLWLTFKKSIVLKMPKSPQIGKRYNEPHKVSVTLSWGKVGDLSRIFLFNACEVTPIHSRNIETYICQRTRFGH